MCAPCSAVAAIQKEIVDLRVQLRHMFEGALAVGLDPGRYDEVTAEILDRH